MNVGVGHAKVVVVVSVGQAMGSCMMVVSSKNIT